jgi:hypothetical protein
LAQNDSAQPLVLSEKVGGAFKSAPPEEIFGLALGQFM